MMIKIFSNYIWMATNRHILIGRTYLLN